MEGCIPSKTVLQETCKSCKLFSCKTCKILHWILHVSCKSCTKNEAFLERWKKSCKILARKNCKIIFLQDLIKILQENYLADFSCKILTRFFISYKKSFNFSARLASYSAKSCKSYKKTTCKIWIFLARRLLLGMYVCFTVKLKPGKLVLLKILLLIHWSLSK